MPQLERPATNISVSFPAELLLLAWVLLSILSTGMAVVHRFLRMRGLDLIGYGAGAGILAHGPFGLWIALVDRYHRQITGLLCCVAIASLAYLWKRKVIVDLAKDLTRPIKIFLGIWIAFIVFCIAITHLEIKWPLELPDGQYVFKTHTLNVKIQVLTSLPADNSIAYVVQEYFLRRIPFREEHPVIPNTEVTMRTVLMSLSGLPFRAVIDPPARYKEPLPKTLYGGPNVGLLYSDSGFRQFLTMSVAFNSLLLLGIGLFCVNLGIIRVLPIAAILFATNPYFISQTIFSWPKSLAGFFVLLAWDAFRRGRGSKIIGACSTLAYHCHPFAVSFLAGMGACCCLVRDPKNRWRMASGFLITAGLLLLPWIIWTRGILQIPSVMFSSNFNPSGVHAIFPNPIWVRLLNVFITFIPTFALVYPFKAQAVVIGFTSSLPGAAGLIFFVPGLIRLLRSIDRTLLYAGIGMPAALIILVFGSPNQPILHGLQPIAAALLFMGVAHGRDHFKPAIYWTLIALQLILNLILVVSAGSFVGAHFG